MTPQPIFDSPSNGEIGDSIRHKLVTYYAIMKKSDFENAKIGFACFNPASGESISLSYDSSSFRFLH